MILKNPNPRKKNLPILTSSIAIYFRFGRKKSLPTYLHPASCILHPSSAIPLYRSFFCFCCTPRIPRVRASPRSLVLSIVGSSESSVPVWIYLLAPYPVFVSSLLPSWKFLVYSFHSSQRNSIFSPFKKFAANSLSASLIFKL